MYERHGKRNTKLYNTWCNMRRRCYEPTNKCYSDYGGRGITVCDEWQEFIPFYDWAMANGYKEELTLDRIDNEKGYSPDNCRWADIITQANNRRNVHLVTYRGETRSLKQWCIILGLNYSSIKRRYYNGWNVTEMFETPFSSHSPKHKKGVI
jgi:hypothetical protein